MDRLVDRRLDSRFQTKRYRVEGDPLKPFRLKWIKMDIYHFYSIDAK